MTGVMILFLPPYSPDLNPIEESFSTCKHPYVLRLSLMPIFTGKAHLRHHYQEIRDAEDPFEVLLESTACITPEMAVGWFRHAGYIW
jgi:hypothetical protein